MKTAYKVKPYFGAVHSPGDGGVHEKGFFLIPITVDADTEQDAIEKVVALYREEGALEHAKASDEWSIWTFPTTYWDGKGGRISGGRYERMIREGDGSGGYTYDYLNFNNVEEV